jgi:cytochrome c553
MNTKLPVIAAALLGATVVSTSFAAGERELTRVMTRIPDLGNGEQIYRTCAACHGAHGEGIGDGSVPALAGQPFSVIARQIVDFRSGTRNDERMAHFTDQTHLSFSQPIADVAGYISKLKRLPGRSAPVRPDAERGAMVYVRNCEVCHGPVGEGDENMVMPRVASQRYEYIVKQLKDAAEGRRPDLAEAHTGMKRELAPDEVKAVAAWLESLPPDE